MQAMEYALVAALVIAGSVGGVMMLQSNTAQTVQNSVMNIGETASSSQVGQEPIKGLPGDAPPIDSSPPVLGGGGLGGPRGDDGGGGGIRPGGWNPSDDQPSGGIEPVEDPIEIGNLGGGPDITGDEGSHPDNGDDDSPGATVCPGNQQPNPQGLCEGTTWSE